MKTKKSENFLKVERNRRFFHKLCAAISNSILETRIHKGMNQAEFAEYMGVSQGMVSRWEGGSYNFTIETIANICDHLDVTPKLYFEDNTQSAPLSCFESLPQHTFQYNSQDLLLKAG